MRLIVTELAPPKVVRVFEIVKPCVPVVAPPIRSRFIVPKPLNVRPPMVRIPVGEAVVPLAMLFPSDEATVTVPATVPVPLSDPELSATALPDVVEPVTMSAPPEIVVAPV